jgi:glucose/arabinose dehydrogenase
VRRARRAVAALAGVAALGAGGAAARAALVPVGALLNAPADIRADYYARDLPRPTAFAADAHGGLWATSGAGGATPEDGVWFVARRGATPRHVVRGIPTPLGLHWFHGELYVAERGRVEAFSRFNGRRFAKRRTVVAGLPVGLHQDAGITVGPDGRVYLGLGSPCDHCRPASPRSATVLSFRPDGSGLSVVARGLRYAYGLAFLPGTSDLFATENGRDDLGLNAPPDELNLIRRGRDYGYPGCWGQGGSACAGKTGALAKLPPHASADGIAFVTGEWGPRYGTSAFVALFGSSFTPPTGRVVVRIALTRSGGGYTARVSTFATGFDTPLAMTRLGRALVVGDFSRGTVYRLRPR